MLLAATVTYEPFGLWLLPNALAALAGTAFWIVRRGQYQASLRMMLISVALLALLAAYVRADIQRLVALDRSFNLFRYWWGSGCAISVPLWFAGGVFYCRLFHKAFDHSEVKA